MKKRKKNYYVNFFCLLIAILCIPACSKINMKVRTIGWYKDYGINSADDLNNPEAVKVFHDLSSRANKYMTVAKNKKVLEEILAVYNEFAGVLGILSKREEKIPKEILSFAKKRDDARKSKEWDSADELRKKIEEKGYIVEDSDTGFRIKKK